MAVGAAISIGRSAVVRVLFSAAGVSGPAESGVPSPCEDALSPVPNTDAASGPNRDAVTVPIVSTDAGIPISAD